MTTPIDSANTYTDFQGLIELKRAAKQNSPEALRAVAEQFEALFIQQMLKGMRDANLGEGLLDSNAGDMYQDMFDKQISLNMSQGQGIGIADMLVRKLSHTIEKISKINQSSDKKAQIPNVVPPNPAIESTNKPSNNKTDTVAMVSNKIRLPVESPLIPRQTFENISTPLNITNPETFVKKLWPLAVKAGNDLGVDPKVILAQAALETGWGRAIKQTSSGTSSHNLFNIKAGSKWDGNTIRTNADEIINNQVVKEVSHFRVYESYADSFTDYVDLLKNNSRYYKVLKQADDSFAYVNGLQDAGYATDPKYADKIMQIVDSKKIENSLSDLKISLHRPITK